MSVSGINTINQAYIATENVCNPLFDLRNATDNLLIHLETLLKNMVSYQVKQGHFKKYYDILPNEKSTFRSVKVSYEGQAVYSNQEARAAQIEKFNEYIERLTAFYHAMGTQQIDVWRTALAQLESFKPQVQIDGMVHEYIRSLPIQSQREWQRQLSQADKQCGKALRALAEVNCSASTHASCPIHSSPPLSEFLQKLVRVATRFLGYLRQSLEPLWKDHLEPEVADHSVVKDVMFFEKSKL